MSATAVDTSLGLTAAQVEERRADGRTNAVPDAPVRSFGQIARANILTPVNAIISTLFVLILVAGYPQDALFAGVVIANSTIGIVQEIRARSTLRELELLNAPVAVARRDGHDVEMAVSEVVADEILVVSSGDQIVVDGEVVSAVGLDVDESLLTGESDALAKHSGDQVMSGSFVASGSGLYRATAIGSDSYAAKLVDEARVFKLADSELRNGVNTILRWLTFIIPPAAGLLLIRQLDSDEVDSWQQALQGTVAASVAMVPDGLVLLTSLAFIVGILSLARRKALAKELASVELLARVDTLCLDKTGTITTGEISYGDVETLEGVDEQYVSAALGALGASDENPNPTLAAIVGAHPAPADWIADEVTPFSSARKWAATHFEGRGSFYLGAPEILLDDGADTLERVAELAAAGSRILLLAHTEEIHDTERAPNGLTPLALVTLEDTVRSDAPEILEYFREQGVRIKVISGDNPATVAAVARRAGVHDADAGVDARTLPDPDEEFDAFTATVESTHVFGRVTPHQKRAMVRSLQSEGHVVAMTGDGVNDVLALKDADMGIAMGAGSPSTRAVAQLVLLDNRFSTLPVVVAEGRRVINNIERVANLFITKAAYAVLLTLLVGLVGSPFPFLPRQLTLIGTFSIGIPGFFLALSPNTALVRPGFLRRVLLYSIPAGVMSGAAAYAVYEVTRSLDDVSLAEARTCATVTLLSAGLVVLVVVSRPLEWWKVALAAAMGVMYVGVVSIPFLRNYFELDVPPADAWPVVAAGMAVACFGVWLVPLVVGRAADGRSSP
ncbi:HAD-IC family P-type ATPase [Ilumatobacter nonamiensis]|uniref:HAD-IC family P-type ATPase n=1 Tax=Ilumatobacter nonamiensis TaxID=467093 RepID=UPI000346CCFB|nr:HAD-IC family P-type ATPase [Ilumatobacter nonamiensis]